MMQQSNALRKLEEILSEAVTSGDRNQISGYALLKAMKIGDQPHLLVDFYEILNEAEEEAKSIRDKPKISRYIQTMEKLHHTFVVNHLWGETWNTFASYIEDKDVLNTLDALAEFFSSQNPAIFLEQDFLDKLGSSFEDLLGEICKSDLSQEFKSFLEKRIEDILRAVRRYHIDGTEGLEKAAKSLVTDLVMVEHSLKSKDKGNPDYKRVKAWVLSLLIYIAPTPCDIIGAVPDINDFWVPKFEKLVAGREQVEQVVGASRTIQEAFENASKIFNRQQQKTISGGKELKALPASKEDLGADTFEVHINPLATELPNQDDEREAWFSTSINGLREAYDVDEVEYSLDTIKEMNPEYEGR